MKSIKRIFRVILLIAITGKVIAQDVIEIPNVRSYKAITSGSNGGPTLTNGDNFGRAIASIGDINNDGINDIAVGANLDNTGGTDCGVVYICFMNTDGTVKTSPAPVKIGEGTAGFQPLDPSDNFGVSVAGIGDLNGDGYEDIAVGASGTDTTIGVTTFTDVGSVFILFLNSSGGVIGRKEITKAENWVPTDSLNTGVSFGFSIANLGDINGDGTNDLAVGAPQYPGSSSGEGSLWILRMNTNGTVKNFKRIRENVNCPSLTLLQNDFFGFSVCAPGDLDLDGKKDVVVGASGEDNPYTDAGAFYVLYLDTSGIATSKKKLSYPLMTNYYFPSDRAVSLGESICATDINEDGITDLVTGARSFNSSKGGMYFIILDSAQNIQRIKTVSFNYSWNYAGPGAVNYGVSMAEIDLGDTYTKRFVVGANMHSSQQGSFYTMKMDSLTYDYGIGSELDKYVKINDYSGNFSGSLASSDFFGIDVAAIGDLNDDGYDDLVVGAHGNDDVFSGGGAAWVLFLDSVGKVSSYNEIRSGTTNFTALGTDHNLGWGLAPAGDFDNDGVEDVFVGAPGNDDGGTDRGAVYLIYLNTNGTVKTYSKIANGTNLTLANTDRFGVDIDTIGDLDNNGVVDIIVGAYQNDDGGTNRGAAYIVFLKSDGTVKKSKRISHTMLSTWETLTNGCVFGIGVAGIGDINSDGKEDVAVGSNLNSTGAVHILTLDTSGNVVTYKKINNAASNFPYTLTNGHAFGASLDMIPDIDGNGVNDLIVGQSLRNVYGISRGSCWIVMLDSLGNVLDAKVTLNDSSGYFYTHTNAAYNIGHCVEYMGTDTSGRLKIAFGGRDDEDQADKGAVFTIAMATHLYGPSAHQYVGLKRNLDGSYYNLASRYLRVKYTEQYFDTDSELRYDIFDRDRNSVLNNTTNTQIIGFGTNQLIIDVNSLAPKKYYVLEVRNQKNEVQKLRFKKNNYPIYVPTPR